MSKQFTPGPWEYCPCGCGFVGGGDDQVAKIIDGEWGDVGIDLMTGKRELVHHWGTVAPETAQANGRLIAAAPCLYEALETCLAMGERQLKAAMNLRGQSPYDIGIAALAKARGEQ